MGKLAERLSDPARAGVYRIESTEAVEEAAALNSYPLRRVALNGSIVPALEAVSRAGERVIVFTGFERLAREREHEMQALLASIAETARAWRARSERIFVAFLDPSGALPGLAPLYNWGRGRTPVQASGTAAPNCSASSASPRSSTK